MIPFMLEFRSLSLENNVGHRRPDVRLTPLLREFDLLLTFREPPTLFLARLLETMRTAYAGNVVLAVLVPWCYRHSTGVALVIVPSL